MNVLVINGPNLNLLGTREPEIYGTETLADLEEAIRKYAGERDIKVRFFQSNHEGGIIDELHAQRTWAEGILINAAAFTHYSYAIRDAISAVSIPAVEVHLSDLQVREPFRRISVIRDVCIAACMGRRFDSYLDALRILADFHAGT